LIQISSSDEIDDAGRGDGLARKKLVNAGIVFASAHRVMPSAHTSAFRFVLG
jgi:hypothetical protein